MKFLENTRCRDTATETPSRPWIFITILYYLVLSVVSQIPGQTLKDTGVRIWDKGAHFVAYSLFGFILMMAFIRLRGNRQKFFSVFFVALIAASAGALDEFHQSFVEGRNASVLDFFADTLGGISGAIVAMVRPHPLAVLNHFRNSRENNKYREL
jgi:VanZ family protein